MASAKYQVGAKKKVYPRMTRIHMSKQRGQFLLNQAWIEGDAKMKKGGIYNSHV
jgi:hypothetical protein